MILLVVERSPCSTGFRDRRSRLEKGDYRGTWEWLCERLLRQRCLPPEVPLEEGRRSHDCECFSLRGQSRSTQRWTVASRSSNIACPSPNRAVPTSPSEKSSSRSSLTRTPSTFNWISCHGRRRQVYAGMAFRAGVSAIAPAPKTGGLELQRREGSASPACNVPSKH